MYRTCFVATIVAILVGNPLFAEEIEGVFKKFENDKVTIEADGKAMTFKIDPNAKVKIPEFTSLQKDGTIKKTDSREVALTKILEAAKDGKYIVLFVEKETVTGARTWKVVDRRKK
jgi:hypothetical protein